MKDWRKYFCFLSNTQLLRSTVFLAIPWILCHLFNVHSLNKLRSINIQSMANRNVFSISLKQKVDQIGIKCIQSLP
jgi:uncharacterized protein YifN (PemK superfamily)